MFAMFSRGSPNYEPADEDLGKYEESFLIYTGIFIWNRVLSPLSTSERLVYKDGGGGGMSSLRRAPRRAGVLIK